MRDIAIALIKLMNARAGEYDLTPELVEARDIAIRTVNVKWQGAQANRKLYAAWQNLHYRLNTND